MGEQIAGGRIIALAMIANDMQEVKELADKISRLKFDFENLTIRRAEVLAAHDRDLDEIKSKLESREAMLAEVAERLDRTFFEMYQVAPVGGVVLEKVKTPRAKKGAAPAAAEPVKETVEVEGDAQEVQDQAPEQPLEEKTAVAYEPLAKQLGICELCQGWGVVDGELYGEFALVPCICEAGKVVEGGAPGEDPEQVDGGARTTFKCCEECSVENPDCSSCQLQEQETAEKTTARSAVTEEPARCASGPCTATGKKPKDVCLLTQGKECRNFVPVTDCKHWVHKQTTQADGSITCDLCDSIIQEAPPVDAGAAVQENAGQGEGAAAEPVKAALVELTDLQKNCPHPKPFRETVEGVGVRCKVCLLVVEPVQVAAVEVIKGADPKFDDQGNCVAGCGMTRMKWETDAETGTRSMYCQDCGRVSLKKDKDGKEISVEPGERVIPFEADSKA